MLKPILTARARALNALGCLHEDTCKIINYLPIEGEHGETIYEEDEILEDVKCRLSIKNTPAVLSEDAPKVSREIKLFLAPDVYVQAGSKVIVEHIGNTTTYVCSSIPAVYATHQEIELVLERDYA